MNDTEESTNSNETSATPQTVVQPDPSGNGAILAITLINGLVKEYDLPISDVNAFLNWYDAKDAGTGPSKFAIDKYSNIKGPFNKRVDYVIFNNILTFEVSSYTM
ncbi:hypothetical protein P4H66_05580 [Paenibacillus dokdonensis]|uniref:Uncharacterized protein n=1 Tax=Paenibacillus dokdonensis TaxID=2567944 RepID=A0ABU6GHX8_9BACL|nr:hypothetical protein [Paenibacillus dokdonensis]MEC0239328.1 hypothetical protein [Paenibacillus dokdonensis]